VDLDVDDLMFKTFYTELLNFYNTNLKMKEGFSSNLNKENEGEVFLESEITPSSLPFQYFTLNYIYLIVLQATLKGQAVKYLDFFLMC
jgi:hypothetical protein